MELYRLSMITLAQLGDLRHPATVIRELAPDAVNLECISYADCWMFEVPQPLERLPAYVTHACGPAKRAAFKAELIITRPDIPQQRQQR